MQPHKTNRSPARMMLAILAVAAFVTLTAPVSAHHKADCRGAGSTGHDEVNDCSYWARHVAEDKGLGLVSALAADALASNAARIESSAGSGLANINTPLADGSCVVPLQGHDDRAVLWTPTLVVNSPYLGQAEAASGTSISTTFHFGRAISLAYEGSESTTMALEASDGESRGWYFLLEWQRVHYHFTGGRHCGGGAPFTEDYWHVVDYAPTGNREHRPAWLTGASPTTDNDNLLVPDFGAGSWESQWPAIAIDFRYSPASDDAPNDHICTNPGEGEDAATVTVASSKLYRAGAELPANGYVAAGWSSAQTSSNSYSYTLPGGHCWDIHRPGGAGTSAAFNYEGLNNPGAITELEWVNPRPFGCDALDFVENFLGQERELWDYTVHMEADMAEEGVLFVEPSTSLVYETVDEGSFNSVEILDGGKVMKADYAKTGSDLFFDSDLTMTMNYEFDESLPIPFKLRYWTSTGPWEFDMLGTPDGDSLHVQILSTTAPESAIKDAEGTVTQALLGQEGNLLESIGFLLLLDPDFGFFTSDVHCNADLTDIGPTIVSQQQEWQARAELYTTDILTNAAVSPTDVRVYLDVA